MRETARHQWLLVALCCGVYLTNLGGTHLWDEDEAHFGRTAQEMVQRGDLIVPYFNGEISLHKPVLMYWVMIASTQLLGVSEFAARIGSAIFATLNVLLVYQIGNRLFSRRAGLWSGLVLATCLHFVLIARAAVVDQELMFFSTLPVLIFVSCTRLSRYSEQHASCGRVSARDLKWWQWALAYLSMGIGALAKGPVAVVLPCAVIGLFLLMSHADSVTPTADRSETKWTQLRRWVLRLVSPLTFLRTVWEMRPLTLILAVCAVALPWYIAVGLRTDGEWLRGFFLVHNVGRFSRSFEGHAGGAVYYIVAICVGTYPWSVFTFQAFQQMRSEMQPGQQNRAAYQLLCSWVLVWVGAFTMASTKLPHYVIPCYPALAMFFAAFVTRWLEGQTVVRPRWIKLAFGNLIFIGVCVTVAVPVVAHHFLPGEEFLGVIGLIPLIGGIVAFRSHALDRRPAAAVSMVAIGACLTVTVLGWAAERVDRRQSSPVIGEWLQDLEDEPRSSRFVTFGYFDSSLVYYADRRLNEHSDPDAIVRMFEKSDRPTYVLTTDERIGELEPRLPEGVGVIRETPRFMREGTLFLIGRTGSGAGPARIAEQSEASSRL